MKYKKMSKFQFSVQLQTIFLLITSIVCYSINNYKLAEFSQCTIHLKVFSYEKKYEDIAEQIIIGRKDFKRPWTIHGFNDTRMIQPIPNVFEQCSIILIVKAEDKDYYRLFISIWLSKYVYDLKPNSNIIILRETLPTYKAIYKYGVRWSVRIFFWVIKESQTSWHFFCPYCYKLYQPLIYQLSQQENPSEITTLRLQKYWGNPDITVYWGIAMNKPRDCVILKNTMSYLRTYQNETCYAFIVFLESIAMIYNISIVYNKDSNIVDSMVHGLVHPNSVFQQHSFPNSIYRNANSRRGIGLIYCDYNIKSDDVSLKIWLSPFNTQIWQTFAISILAITITFSLFRKRGNKSWELSDLLLNLIAISMIPIRQMPSNSRVILQIFALAMTIYVSVYENDIASALIVPVKEPEIQNLKELIDTGYKIINFDVQMVGYPHPILNLKPDFDHFGIGDKLNESVIFPNMSRIAGIKKFIGKGKGKFAVYDNTASLQSSMYLFSIIQGFNPHFKCYRVKENLLSQTPYDLFVVHIRKVFIDKLQTFVESGIYELWKDIDTRWISWNMAWSVARWEALDRVHFISLKNLSSFLIIFASLYLFTLFVFFVEIGLSFSKRINVIFAIFK